MTVWLRARHAAWWATVAVVLALVAGLAAGRLPSLNLLYRNSEGAPLRLVLPAIVATAILTTLISPTPRAEFTSTRHPSRDLALSGLLAVTSIAVAEATPLALDNAENPGTFSRNLLGLLGVGMIGRVFLPAALAPLLPLAWMIPTLTLGSPEGDVMTWPLLADATDPRGVAAAAVLLAAGLTAEHTRARRIPHRAY
jgi:hypothetical protein